MVHSREAIEQLINTNDMVLVYFGSKICGVCTNMKPRIIEILEKYPQIRSAYVDVEKSHTIAVSYNFFTVPGILLFIQGKETIREAGHISLKDINDRISRYYNLWFKQ